MYCRALLFCSSGLPGLIRSGYACSSPTAMAMLFKPWRCKPPVFSQPPSPGAVYCAASNPGLSRSCVSYKRMDSVSLVCEELHDGTHRARHTLRPCASLPAAAVTAGVEPFTCKPGQALPLGASQAENGINFALFSQHATSVSLCM
jgi:hypothetical protein